MTILTIDIGNSNIVFGLFIGKKHAKTWWTETTKPFIVFANWQKSLTKPNIRFASGCVGRY